jgi:hypothetical protein
MPSNKQNLKNAFDLGYHTQGMSYHTDLAGRERGDGSHPYAGHPMNDEIVMYHDRQIGLVADELPDGWKSNSQLMMSHELGQSAYVDTATRWAENANSGGGFVMDARIKPKIKPIENVALSLGEESLNDKIEALRDKSREIVGDWRGTGEAPPISGDHEKRWQRVGNQIHRLDRIQRGLHPFTGEVVRKPSRFISWIQDNYPKIS